MIDHMLPETRRTSSKQCLARTIWNRYQEVVKRSIFLIQQVASQGKQTLSWTRPGRVLDALEHDISTSS